MGRAPAPASPHLARRRRPPRRSPPLPQGQYTAHGAALPVPFVRHCLTRLFPKPVCQNPTVVFWAPLKPNCRCRTNITVVLGTNDISRGHVFIQFFVQMLDHSLTLIRYGLFLCLLLSGLSMASFNSLSQQLIDIWVNADSMDSPKDLYETVIADLSIKMALSVIETVASDPYDWQFLRVRQWGYKSKILKLMLAECPDSLLRHLDRTFIDRDIIPAFQRALDTKRPNIDLVKTQFLGIRICYERVILPQKTEGTPRWCVSLAEGRFAIPSNKEIRHDLTDEGIVQLLIEGNTSKQIAEILNLSSRTIEHRIDKMKMHFEANNTVHLVAKLVASQVDRPQAV